MKKEIKRIDVKYIKRYQKNPKDIEAFNIIYNFYKDYLLYFAFTYTRSMSDAEEVVQETFYKMIRKIHTLEKPESFHAWLYTICYTNAMLHYRSKNKYYQLDEENGMEEIEDMHINTEDTYTKKQIYEEVDKAIKNLGVRFQSIAQLYYFDNLKIREIAGVLDVPEGTVKSRLNKIRSDLKTQLEEKGIQPKHFLSVGFAPFMLQYFQAAAQHIKISPQDSIHMVDGLIKTISGISISAVSIKSAPLLSKVKIATSFAVALLGTGCIAYLLPKDEVTIEKVSYYQELTNNTLQVDILLNREMSKDTIKVKSEKQKLAFTKNKNKISFDVEKNGTYEVSVGRQKQDIHITNIDKEAPIMKGVGYVDKGIKIDVSDNHEVDYHKSYALYDNKKYPIDESQFIEGDFKDTAIKLYLYDKSGNTSTYDITATVVK